MFYVSVNYWWREASSEALFNAASAFQLVHGIPAPSSILVLTPDFGLIMLASINICHPACGAQPQLYVCRRLFRLAAL